MPKFYGNIGFALTAKTSPGVYEEVITEKPYRGDLIRNTRRLEQGDKVNDDLVINNLVSVVADSFANENFQSIRYVLLGGTKWKVSFAELNRPRILLTLGKVYNDGD